MMRTFVDWTQHEAQVRLEERALLAAVMRDTREIRSDLADLGQEIRSSGATTPFGRNCISLPSVTRTVEPSPPTVDGSSNDQPASVSPLNAQLAVLEEYHKAYYYIMYTDLIYSIICWLFGLFGVD